ncbi:MAG: murein biosynthesis integral membrane protein MurJ, partial [Clostridiaceae bacterium]|nr:murein biosynthesis integral membrane protein MurJ [Clostridiaceae bacterium]
PALIGLPLNFFLIGSIILSFHLDNKLLAYGKVIAVIAQLVFLAPFLFKEGYKYKPMFSIKDNNIGRLVYLSIPVILGTSVNQINKLVDRTIASQIAIGGISGLIYASRLIWYIQGIFVMSLVTVLFTSISKKAANNDIKGLKKSLVEAIVGINLFLIPTTIGAMIFSQPIIELLYGRGEFDYYSVKLTSNVLFYYSIGMLGFGLREVLSRAFFSLQDTKTPMANAVLGMVLNVILNLILSKYLGIGGLALATSISAIVTTILMGNSLRKKIGHIGSKTLFISSLKIILASLIMGLISKFTFEYLKMSKGYQNLSLVIAIAIGILIYFGFIYFMKIEEVDVIKRAVKKKCKRIKNKYTA